VLASQCQRPNSEIGELQGHLTYCTDILNASRFSNAAGNRRQSILFEPADDALYRDMLAERCWRREKQAMGKMPP
jgi:hypothetical protein